LDAANTFDTYEMTTFTAMFGDKLRMTGGEEVDTQEALKDAKAVALYFSAHWCPPCRGFTPKFAEAYTSHLKAKGLEVVFVSSDRDEAAFKEYAGEQPWLSLPYAARDLKAALSKKYKVSGIPSLVILDPEGNTITKEGRGCITSDPEGKEFPWTPPSLEELLDQSFVAGDGSEVKWADLKGKPVGLYFSAHWCPPCRGFTPKLIDTYKKVKEAGKEFEVIFVSSDRDEGAFKEYFGEMPWLALPYSERGVKEKLSSHFGIEGIPSFVMIGEDGKVISDNCRGAVGEDPEGKNFPWHPKPVNDLHSPEGINDTPSLCVLMEEVSKEEQDRIVADLEAVAKPIFDGARAVDKDQPYCFFTATSGGGVVDRVRQLTNLGEAGDKARVVILDCDDDGAYYQLPADKPINKDSLAKFLSDFDSQSLEKLSFA